MPNGLNIHKDERTAFSYISIKFFHSLETEENIMVQDSFQLNGTNAHKHSDSAAYSTEKSVLQGVSEF